MIILVDSGPLGRLMEGDRALQSRLRRALRQGHVFEVPPLVRTEMFAAVWSMRTLRTRLHQVLGEFGGESTTIEEGAHAGELLGRLGLGRRMVSMVDALLAAAASRRSAAVLTDDFGDFKRLREAGAARFVTLKL